MQDKHISQAKRMTFPMAGLRLKLPPPLYLALGLGLIYLASRRGQASKPAWRWLGLPLIATGLGLDVHALLNFRRHHTTPNPFHPERASHLVNQGAYRYSRNPMYLGMALILSGWSLIRGSLSGLLVVPAFVWTLTQLQIIPEEQELARKFGEPYLAYRKQVRRWL
ncbi:MAG: isoprenylcysteine carboxylmethyltransferase family protein [Candidatus Melainabacteria bacterium HGW-Melainabacteria-1]|nr:MAG: isoprenylcysteine carboxylmethyltransferase family protein [Candidatus Melainabacteria bacterium HGW-Melainabacteria-1]